MDKIEFRQIFREELDNSPRFNSLEQKVDRLEQKVDKLDQKVNSVIQELSRVGILQEELNSKMDFVLEALQPTIEKVNSVDGIKIELETHEEEISMTKHTLKSHLADDNRHN